MEIITFTFLVKSGMKDYKTYKEEVEHLCYSGEVPYGHLNEAEIKYAFANGYTTTQAYDYCTFGTKPKPKKNEPMTKLERIRKHFNWTYADLSRLLQLKNERSFYSSSARERYEQLIIELYEAFTPPHAQIYRECAQCTYVNSHEDLLCKACGTSLLGELPEKLDIPCPPGQTDTYLRRALHLIGVHGKITADEQDIAVRLMAAFIQQCEAEKHAITISEDSLRHTITLHSHHPNQAIIL